ncbi:hypothetical protein BVI2075_320304 [Burkholderia vietnamiensis]|nr:hypothetical protein BVI2075_320304 [Burkholderia vietnamiensis]
MFGSPHFIFNYRWAIFNMAGACRQPRLMWRLHAITQFNAALARALDGRARRPPLAEARGASM